MDKAQPNQKPKKRVTRRKVPLIGPAVVAATNAVARVADLGHDEGRCFPAMGEMVAEMQLRRRS